MNIAEKLKNTLSEEHVKDKFLDFVYSEHDEKKGSNKSNGAKVNIATIKPKLARLNKFEDLISKLVAKIENTPCWSKFSESTKEQMINKYFETKVKSPEYKGVSYTPVDKMTFVTEVLKSVV